MSILLIIASTSMMVKNNYILNELSGKLKSVEKKERKPGDSE
jgi:hypothetical protein